MANIPSAAAIGEAFFVPLRRHRILPLLTQRQQGNQYLQATSLTEEGHQDHLWLMARPSAGGKRERIVEMCGSGIDGRDLFQRLRRALPLTARSRAALLASIRKLHPDGPLSPICVVTGVFDAGGERGVMCKLELHGAINCSPTIVASIAQITIDRRHPISHEIAIYRKRYIGDHRRRRARAKTDRASS